MQHVPVLFFPLNLLTDLTKCSAQKWRKTSLFEYLQDGAKAPSSDRKYVLCKLRISKYKCLHFGVMTDLI